VVTIVVRCAVLIVVLVVVLCKFVPLRSAPREEWADAVGLFAAAVWDLGGARSERRAAVLRN
jgi:hypothetical protein